MRQVIRDWQETVVIAETGGSDDKTEVMGDNSYKTAGMGE